MKTILPLSIAVAMMGGAAQAQTKLPELKKQPTAQAVLDEHFAALNACDWDRLLAQYPEDAQINLPNMPQAQQPILPMKNEHVPTAIPKSSPINETQVTSFRRPARAKLLSRWWAVLDSNQRPTD